MSETLKMFKVVFKNGLDMIVECESVELMYRVDGIRDIKVMGSNKAIEFLNIEEILYIQEI